MFGKGNWAIYGLNPESHTAFTTNLENLSLMLGASQLAAGAVTRYREADAFGINPYNAPRLDEKFPLASHSGAALAAWALRPTDDADMEPPSNILEGPGYAFSAEAFQIHPNLPYYGFWFVDNEWKDVSHIASVKEQIAINNHERPYKFLNSDDKKVVDSAATGTTAAKRVQFPVLIDYQAGRVYVENTSPNLLFRVQTLLRALGAEVESVAWVFGETSHWPTEVLQKLYADSSNKTVFIKAAEDASRFREDEREEIEDPELKALVSKFFSTTQLESELWASLGAPAKVTLHKTLGAIAVTTPVGATTLLQLTPDANPFAASIMLQERVSKISRKGDEKVFRRDTLSFLLDDQMNLTDSGAAALRGFDLPAFRRGILREIKKSKRVPDINEFWASWLIQMNSAVQTIASNLRDILQIVDQPSGIIETGSSPSDDDDVIEAGE
jgi:hypothetical protein